MNRMKRFLALLLAVVLVLGYVPGKIQAKASAEDGLCDKHHAKHDADCGYAEAKEGSACSHTSCDENCLTEALCAFIHEGCGCMDAVGEQTCDKTCDYALKAIEVTCECSADENGTLTHGEDCDYEARLQELQATYGHSETCGYAAGSEAVYCGHVCAEELGCVLAVCTHTHTEECGYAEPVEAAACKYAGAECAFCAACVEGCTLEKGHEGDCVLPCETEGCVKTAGHEDGCAQTCGCPVNAERHLETCIQTAATDTAETKPLFVYINNAYREGPITLDKGDMFTEVRFALAKDGTWVEDLLEHSRYYTNIIQVEQQDESRPGVYTITGVDGSGNGSVTLTYVDGNNNSYSVDFVVGGWALVATMEGSRNTDPRISMKQGQSSNVTFKLGSGNGFKKIEEGTFTSSDSTILEVEDYDDVANVCGLNAVAAGTADVIYTNSNGVQFHLPVTIEKTLMAKVGGKEFSELTLNKEDETSVEFCLDGVTIPLEKLQISGDAITLTAGDNGQCKLTANRQGTATVTYKVNDKQYSCSVKVVLTKGYLHYLDHTDQFGTYPVTCWDLPVGSEVKRCFYFGEKPVRKDDPNFSWSGAITVKDMDSDGGLVITADKIGTGYLEYKTTENGQTVLNCFVFNVTDSNMSRPSGTMIGSYLRYGNTDIGFGGAGLIGRPADTMILYHEVTGVFNNVNCKPFDHRAMVAAIKRDGQPDTDLLNNRIKNVNFTVLSALYPNGLPAEKDRLHLSQTKATWVNITDNLGAYANHFVAGAGVEFDAKVGVTFDLVEGNVLRRISLHTNSYVNFSGNQVEVVASDIDSAAKLNSILFSREALLNWIKAKHESGRTEEGDMGLEYAATASDIHIYLPAADLSDAVVVCQAIGEIPFVAIPIATQDFRIILHGDTNGGTKMAGLISKGSVFGINNIIFEADPKVTMTREGVSGPFTCGIMADPLWKGNVQYDMIYFNEYGKGTKQHSITNWNNDLKYMHCDVLSVNGCVFDGFDYGTYSNENGYVGSGYYNTFLNCYYGIYIDSAPKSGWVNKKSNSDHAYYTFHKNVYAVRVKGLQNSISPYDFRIHDSDFINNHIEFAIEDYTDQYLQNYYFYRNHYRGAWDGHGNIGWAKNEHEPPEATTNNAPHRAPNYQILDKNGEATTNGGRIKISGTPGKTSANNARSGSEGYWIYDDANQVTRIMANEELPIAEESLTALTKDTDVSVVTNDGTSTIAVWTFEGGE